MKVTAVSKASGVSYRHAPNKSILKKKVHFSKGSIGKRQVQELLDNDARRIFKKRCKTVEELITKCGFTRYIGDVSKLIDEIDSRKRADFLLLTYLGKMRNVLRTAYTNCDLSNLIFLNRLNTFAKMLQDVSGKPSKVVVSAENRSFDYEIFRFGGSNCTRLIKQARNLASDFGMKNIEIRPLEDFLAGKEYRNAFFRLVGEIKSRKEARKSEEFRVLSNVFINATSATSLKKAVAEYVERPARVRKYAEECAFRYMAFHRARDLTNFWGENKEFIRSTVSTRNAVLTFKYEIGRLAPFQGMSVYSRGVGTEFLNDIIYAIDADEVTLPLLHYRNAPFLLDVRKAVAPKAFASP